MAFAWSPPHTHSNVKHIKAIWIFVKIKLTLPVQELSGTFGFLFKRNISPNENSRYSIDRVILEGIGPADSLGSGPYIDVR